MLTIKVPIGEEGFDNVNQRFVAAETFQLELEHSLVSLSKWESKYEKPFLSGDEKTPEETLDYVRIMTLTPNVPNEVWLNLSKDNLVAINEYINAKMTATWFSENVKPTSPNREAITAELIYYWLVSLQIPFEVQDWHLNRLITLVKVCDHKNQPPKKMSRRELVEQHRRINEQRRREQEARQGKGT